MEPLHEKLLELLDCVFNIFFEIVIILLENFILIFLRSASVSYIVN